MLFRDLSGRRLKRNVYEIRLYSWVLKTAHKKHTYISGKNEKKNKKMRKKRKINIELTSKHNRLTVENQKDNGKNENKTIRREEIETKTEKKI